MTDKPEHYEPGPIMECIIPDYFLKMQYNPNPILPQWISVDDRLPEDKEDVLILTRLDVNGGRMYSMTQATYCEMLGWLVSNYPYDTSANVTHWIPIYRSRKDDK